MSTRGGGFKWDTQKLVWALATGLIGLAWWNVKAVQAMASDNRARIEVLTEAIAQGDSPYLEDRKAIQQSLDANTKAVEKLSQQVGALSDAHRETSTRLEMLLRQK